jgi:hypothetical protein
MNLHLQEISTQVGVVQTRVTRQAGLTPLGPMTAP